MFNHEQPITPAGLQEARQVYEEAQRQLKEALQQASHAFLGDPLDQTLPPEGLDHSSAPPPKK